MRERVATRQLDHPALIDHVPEILDRIADVADELIHGRMRSSMAPTEEYAIERFAQGLDVSDVVAELGLLRECVLARKELVALWSRPHQLRALNRAIDRAISEAVEHYAETRERSFESLYNVATAALETADLDRVLARLLVLLRDAAPSIDRAAVLLREGDRLRVRVSSGWPREAAEARLLEIERESATLQRDGGGVEYRVPLLVAGEMVGAVQVGSSTVTTFTPDVKRIVATMASRIAIAVHQHLLRRTAETRALELEAVIENIPAPIVIAGRERIVRCNKAALELTQPGSPVAMEEAPSALGERLHMRDPDTRAPLPPEEQPLVRALHGEPSTREMLITRGAPGEDLVVRTSAAPIRAREGEVIAAVSVSTDITDVKRTEVQQRERLTHLRAILDYAPAAVYIRDLSGRYVLVNRAYAELSGIDAATAPGKTFRELHPYLPKEIVEAREARDREVIESKTPIQREDTVLIRGERRTYLSFEFPLRDDTGEIYGLCSIAMDITQRKRAEEARDRLIGILGHDLKNPVSAIDLAAKMLESETVSDEGRERIVRRIATSARRMSRMISDLLDFARGHLGGGIPIAAAPSDLQAIVADVVDELQTGNPDLHVHVRATGDLAGEWDKERLAEAVSNLLGNAVVHRTPGTDVGIELTGDRDAVTLVVENRASKRLAPSDVAALFEPFRRAERTVSKNGLGLGLFIVREIVRAHGGTVDAASDDGTFRIVVRLPRRSRVPSS